jgi:hypothetical protein
VVQKLSERSEGFFGMANEFLVAYFDVIGGKALPEAPSFPHRPLPQQRPREKRPLSRPQAGRYHVLLFKRKRGVPAIANDVDK